jgi:hypothetical protein
MDATISQWTPHDSRLEAAVDLAGYLNITAYCRGAGTGLADPAAAGPILLDSASLHKSGSKLLPTPSRLPD